AERVEERGDEADGGVQHRRSLEAAAHDRDEIQHEDGAQAAEQQRLSVHAGNRWYRSSTRLSRRCELFPSTRTAASGLLQRHPLPSCRRARTSASSSSTTRHTTPRLRRESLAAFCRRSPEACGPASTRAFGRSRGPAAWSCPCSRESSRRSNTGPRRDTCWFRRRL